MNTMPLNKDDRMRGGLWGMFVGDALAMPVHWYYNIAALWQDFGQIKDYQAPKAHHPNSIMALANTSKAGRGTQEGDIVGSVILKGKNTIGVQPIAIIIKECKQAKIRLIYFVQGFCCAHLMVQAIMRPLIFTRLH